MANYCVNCGYKTDENWKYCPCCGTELPILENQETKITNVEKSSPKKLSTLKITPEPIKIKQPTLPRKIDRQVLEGRLVEYRVAEKDRLNLPAYCIFNNSTLQAIVEQRNNILTKNDLYEIKGLGPSSINKFGDDIICLLNELDQNYMP